MDRDECFICHSVLVHRSCHLVPLTWRSAGSYRGHGILDLRIKASEKFDHYGLGVGISRLGDEVLEFINVVIKQASLLEVGRGLEHQHELA